MKKWYWMVLVVFVLAVAVFLVADRMDFSKQDCGGLLDRGIEIGCDYKLIAENRIEKAGMEMKSIKFIGEIKEITEDEDGLFVGVVYEKDGKEEKQIFFVKDADGKYKTIVVEVKGGETFDVGEHKREALESKASLEELIGKKLLLSVSKVTVLDQKLFEDRIGAGNMVESYANKCRQANGDFVDYYVGEIDKSTFRSSFDNCYPYIGEITYAMD